jgi:hypothetical protein
MKKNKLFTLQHHLRIMSVVAALAATVGNAQQQTFTFTNAGASGEFGPTQGQINAAYANTNLSGSVTIAGQQGVQHFTVPVSGPYRIVLAGASGGGVISNLGCRGRIVQGETNLIAGQVLKIVVGQRGTMVNTSAGGGGGSFVSTNANVPIIVAGGGGGFYDPLTSPVPSSDGNYGNSGLNSVCGTGLGGGNGAGGMASNSSGWSGGGGGFSSDGSHSPNCASTGGISFVNGANGGMTCNNTTGGFGGGGGTHGNSGGGGGGGGYSGGGGCNQTINGGNAGGGGGSYQMPGMTNLANLGLNSGNGYVILSQLCDVNVTASKNQICIGESVTLSTNAGSNILWTHNGSTAPSVFVTPSSTTSYTVSGVSTSSSACTSTLVITVTVHPLPVINTNAFPAMACAGGNATLSASGANTYTWSTTQTGAQVQISPSATSGYTVTGTSIHGCVSTQTVVANVSTNSLTVSQNTTICSGSSAILTASGAQTYSWSNGFAFQSVPVSPAANTVYTVTGIDGMGCSLTATVGVNVNTGPSILIGANRTTVCRGETADLSASGATSYTWSNGGGANASATYTIPVDVPYVFSVQGADANGCVSSASISIMGSRCVGISESVLTDVMIYPNPANEVVTIRVQELKKVSVYDVTGRLVMSKTSDQSELNLDVKAIPAGIYQVTVEAGTGAGTYKLIKQ